MHYHQYGAIASKVGGVVFSEFMVADNKVGGITFEDTWAAKGYEVYTGVKDSLVIGASTNDRTEML